MTKPARSNSKIEEVRDFILLNALNIIVEEGFSRMTMRKIASASGMSATNLYNYFKNKDEIYLTIVIRGFEKLCSEFESISAKCPDPVERGRGLIRAYIDFSAENTHYYEVMFSSPAPRYNDYVGTELESLAGIEHKYSMLILEIALQTAAAVLKADPGSTAVKNRVIQIWGLLHGVISLYHSNVAVYLVEDSESLFKSIETEFLNVMVKS